MSESVKAKRTKDYSFFSSVLDEQDESVIWSKFEVKQADAFATEYLPLFEVEDEVDE